MKIFISHSFRDRFIARMVAREIESTGAETFLDAKDLTTGSPLVGIISQHMIECDQLLVIASPDSLQSHWVSMEIGAAISNRLEIVVLLHHVTADDLPQPVASALARDINDIEAYLDELRSAQASTAAPSTPGLGGRVRITTAPPEAEPTVAETVEWVPGMDRYAGRTATITTVATDSTAKVDVDGGRHWWHLSWLEPLAEPPAGRAT